MIGQVQVTRYGDPTIAAEKIRAHKEQMPHDFSEPRTRRWR